MTQQFVFTPATKEQAKLRLAIFGPSGSGKTYTSLRLATGLGGKVAFIDTERGSASKYADRFTFDVLELEDKDITTYCTAIAAAEGAGYGVLIIDSLTHAWHDLLDEIEKLARAKYKGNTWSAWSEGTPKQRQLVDAILSYNGHIIATMRTKTEWTTTQDSKGKSRPIRVGLAPEQGKGIEYEFDLLMELTVDHIGSVIKDRTGRYQDEVIAEPGEELGEELAAWLSDGELPPRPEPGIMNVEMPSIDGWNALRDAAVRQLHYRHPEHVKNTLKAIFDGQTGELGFEIAWKGLVDHQLSKETPDA